ncbi:MAG: amidase [Opitutales bacterium]
MPIDLPTPADLQAAARRLSLHLSDAEAEAYSRASAGFAPAYASVEQLPQDIPAVRYPRGPAREPAPAENPCGGWYAHCEVPGAPDGPLAGLRVALKDNVCLAGVPMMNGSRSLEGYVPEFDATVVRRLLDAGATIRGKAVCEDLCISGISETAATGPIPNPYNPDHACAGSSSGSAVLLAAGEVDLAIGCDQGGSVRLPAAWSGTVGLKATHGLVPYTGIFPIEPTMDHAGPMARTVRDVARMLDAIAGKDPDDPRQGEVHRPDSYSADLDRAPGDLKVALVREGFSWEGVSREAVNERVREAAAGWEKLGATVSEISIPEHRWGIHVMIVIGTEGGWRTMFAQEGAAMGWRGFYPTSMMEAFATGRREHGDAIYPSAKILALMGQHLHERYRGRHYARAQNAARHLRRAYDQALETHDLLVMPTIPFLPPAFPKAAMGIEDRIRRANEPLLNTAPFNITGHPALSINAGFAEGLPVGLMLVGRHWQEKPLLEAAHCLEQELRQTINPPSLRISYPRVETPA